MRCPVPASLPGALLLTLLLLQVPVLVASNCGTTHITHQWYVLAGQSNMVGISTQPTGSALGASWRPGPVETLGIADPFFGAGGTSAWPSFARATSWTDHMIASARGNTCLGDVDHPNALRWDPDVGDLYQDTLDLWEDAGRPRLAGWLWKQGECEAGAWDQLRIALGETRAWQYEQSRAHYLGLLLNLADAVERDFGAPLVPSPISLNLCRWDNPSCDPALFEPSEKRRGVHDATIEAAAIHPNITLGPLDDDLRVMPDNTHVWDVNELGNRWATSLP